MRKQFDKDLQTLEQGLFVLAGLVRTNIQTLHGLFQAADDKERQAFLQRELEINSLESDLEWESAKLLALQSPQVSDLRRVIAVMRVCSDLERMGDHLLAIDRAWKSIQDRPDHVELQTQALAMLTVVDQMLEGACQAFSQRNGDLAKEVAAKDSWLDTAYHQLIGQSKSEMKEQETSIKTGAAYLSIAKNLERLGDYITNICERVLYLETGQTVDLNS